MFPLFQIYLNAQQNGKQCCLPSLSFKISLKGTSFYISLNCLGFYLSPKCLLNFSDLYIPPLVGKNFQFMMFLFPENALNLCIFTHAQVPTQNSRQNYLKICFRKGEMGGENYGLLYRNLIRKYEDDLEH